MSQLGRISGPLLEANLNREGVDLTFRNQRTSPDLLTLDVNNNKVNINVPTFTSADLNVDDTVKTIDLISSGTTQLDNITISTNVFSTTMGALTIRPNQTNPLVLFDHLQAGNLDFKDNVVSTTAVNGSIAFNPNGTGTTEILGNTTVNGDLAVTGNWLITGNLAKQGNIIVGDNILDTVTIVPDFTQSIIPGTDLTYDLGKSNKRWRQVHVHDNSNISTLTYNSITISDQLQIDGPSATIRTLQSNDNVVLNSDTGIIDIERIRFTGDTITNLDETALSLSSTGIGYVRFMDTNAVIIPAGPETDRNASPEVGDTRWNTDEQYLECFDGTVWNIATGPGLATVSEQDMEDLSNVWILVLG